MSRRVAVIGIGQHGLRIAEALVQQGAQVAAADPAHAPRPLSEVLDHPDTPDTLIAADATELLTGELPDVAIIAATVDLEGVGSIALPFLDAGVDVLTIHPDAFDPPLEWASSIDQRARAGEASFLATGVQDVWWVHMPAVAASAMTSLTAVNFHHAVDIDSLSAFFGRLLGVGQPEAEFARIRDEVLLTEDSVLGGPMRVLARRLGLTPGPATREFLALPAEQVMQWPSGEQEVAVGHLTGFSETTSFDTDEGVRFTGTLRTALMSGDELPTDRITLHGDPTLHLEHRPFPGERVTDLIPVARIPDLIAAPPGLHTAATMPAPSYRHAGGPPGEDD